MRPAPGHRRDRFYLWFTVFASALGALFWLIPDLSTPTRLALTYGALVSAAVSLSGYLLVVRTADQSGQTLIKRVLAGTAARLVLALAALAVGLGPLGFPPVALVCATLGGYVLFSMLEYYYLVPYLRGKDRGEQP